MLEELAGQQVVVLTPDEYITTKGYADRLRDELGCEVYEMIGVLELAMELDVFAISPRTHAMAFANEGHSAIPIRDVVWGFSLCWRSDKELSEHEREFVAFMQKYRKFYC